MLTPSRPSYRETDDFYGLQTPGYSLTNRLKFGQITVIYGSKDWKLSRICLPYEPEELAVIHTAREWIGVEDNILLADEDGV